MITIIDYHMGNIGSILNMFKKINAEAKVSANLNDIEQADKLVLPGVGAFDAGMMNLNTLKFTPILRQRVLVDKIPILGICLGMQLMGQTSEEGISAGLGWVDAHTVRFNFQNINQNLKIPHMGWNQIQMERPHPLTCGLKPDSSRFYFVHSYHVICHDPKDILAQTHYGLDFVSAFAHENIFGVQFHPEKSHKFGMALLRSFVEL